MAKRMNEPFPWPVVRFSGIDGLQDVLDVSNGGFRLFEDLHISKSVCEVWIDALWEATKLGGFELS